MADERVLLVDDEADFIAVLGKRLEARGLSVVTAADGAEALEAVREKPFDLVILDLYMADMDGIETLKEILKLDKKAQVILLTGYYTSKKSDEAIKHGAVDFLEKPADIQDLLGRIGEAGVKRMVAVEEHSMDRIEDILRSRG